MTDVPEHLLQRSRERRAALGLGGEDGGESPSAPSTAPATAASSVEPAGAGVVATDAEAEAAVGVGEVLEPSYVGPPQLPPRKARVPVWAVPVLAALPFWAVVYGGAFGERKVEPTGPLAVGAQVYSTKGCSSCHGAAGQGGQGPALSQVTKTFPNPADHVAWIHTGSAPVKDQPYGALGRVATGGMPAFAESLSDEQIVAVMCYERFEFGKAAETDLPPECTAAGGTAADQTEDETEAS